MLHSLPWLGEQQGAKRFCRWDRDTSEGGSDARVQQGEWGRPWHAPPFHLSPILYMMQSPVQRLLGFLGRGNSQAAASPELTWAMVLRKRSHHPKPKRHFGFCRK